MVFTRMQKNPSQNSQQESENGSSQSGEAVTTKRKMVKQTSDAAMKKAKIIDRGLDEKSSKKTIFGLM